MHAADAPTPVLFFLLALLISRAPVGDAVAIYFSAAASNSIAPQFKGKSAAALAASPQLFAGAP